MEIMGVRKEIVIELYSGAVAIQFCWKFECVVSL
jgi:hypothetical protein